jgi:UDP-N-acetylglucosamine 4,6-dehydratase
MNILITGGTGSFGRFFTKYILTQNPARVVVFSRDELKQYEMQQEIQDERLRFFIGDIRDKERLLAAFRGVDYVIHAAAMKQVESCEYNPFEAVKTNVLGAQNIIEAAIECKVKKVIALSTDKACAPVNTYGKSKALMESLFVAGNNYAGSMQTRFAVTRYGNVVSSRGSVIPLFLKQRETGTITLTSERMTRFWIALDEAVRFVHASLLRMHGGEIFVPKIPSMKITDLAKAIAPGCKVKVTGIRPGEKLHETLITEDEARHTIEDEGYIILPEYPEWGRHYDKPMGGYELSSDKNKEWLTVKDMEGKC